MDEERDKLYSENIENKRYLKEQIAALKKWFAETNFFIL